jgi:hypothetical protein
MTSRTDADRAARAKSDEHKGRGKQTQMGRRALARIGTM